MLELSNKMRMLYGNPVAQADTFSSIFFGSTDSMARFLDLNRARVRVGLWPIQSDTAPDTAMGIMTVIGLLLENYQNIEVYRLFAKLEGDPQNYAWSMEQSQFSVDDWQLDALGENVAIWGTLTREADEWILKIEVENDLLEEDQPKSFSIVSKTLGKLTTELPAMVSSIAEYLEETTLRPLAQVYASTDLSDEQASEFYGNLFQWELNLNLALWGLAWPAEEARTACNHLLEAARQNAGEFGAWAVSRSAARAMLPGFQPVGEGLVPLIPEIVEGFSEYSYSPVMLGIALYRADYHSEAFELLEDAVESHPKDLTSWLALAELYLTGRQLLQMIQTFQRAIDEGTVSAALYMRYAEMLRLLAFENYPLNDFMLISPEDFKGNDDLITYETIEAYEEVLKLDPEHEDALYQQVLQMAEVVDDRFWDKFSELVTKDSTGEKVRTVVDSLYNFDEVAEGVEILQDAVAKEPNRSDLHANLAALYLFEEKGKAARAELEKARELTQDAPALADIDRLMLSADDPEFEAYLGELTDLINAGSSLEVHDVEFLEDIAEKAPRFAEIYALLGRAYLIWEEPSTALETLLDGQKQVPDDPDILELLGRVLWELDQHELAFEYLNKGLAVSPAHVPLLVRMGRCLFDDDQIDLSKAYLLRAEAINPRHPALNETRLYISRMLETGKD